MKLKRHNRRQPTVADKVLSLAILLLVLVFSITIAEGCAGTPGGAMGTVDIDWSKAVQLKGDVRIEGKGEICLLSMICIKVEGQSDAGGDGLEGSACAGFRLSMAQFSWSWVSATQDSKECQARAGELSVSGP